MVHVAISDIFETSQKALEKHGAKAWIAAHVADAVAKSESVGNRICGLYYLESYCLQLQSGRVNGDVEPLVTQPREALVHVDSRYGFAQPAFARGLPLAIETAQKLGVSTLSISHAHTCTSLGYFTEQIARGGCIGFGLTNASPIVAAPGGKTRIIGTNPIAFSVPDENGGIAMQFDQSTTTVALGKITMAKAAGESIPKAGPSIKRAIRQPIPTPHCKARLCRWGDIGMGVWPYGRALGGRYDGGRCLTRCETA